MSETNGDRRNVDACGLTRVLLFGPCEECPVHDARPDAFDRCPAVREFYREVSREEKRIGRSLL